MTHMSLFVQLIVSELELVEVDDHIHPMRPEGGRVGVHVETGGGAFLFETPNPSGVLVLVSVLVHWDHVHV